MIRIVIINDSTVVKKHSIIKLYFVGISLLDISFQSKFEIFAPNLRFNVEYAIVNKCRISMESPLEYTPDDLYNIFYTYSHY